MTRIARHSRRGVDEIDFKTNEEFRRELGEIALDVAKRGTPVAIGANIRRPTYQLDAAGAVSKRVLATACRIGPDEARKKLSTIRALLRVQEGWAFAIVIGGEPVAVLQRHPRYHARTVEEFRQARMEREMIADLPRIGDRLDALERAIKDLTAALRKAR